MAVYGFSIFLGIFPITIYLVTFLALCTFKKFREDERTYFDGMLCGSLSVYLCLYYAALNYPEQTPTTVVDGKRNLLSCIIVMLVLLMFLLAALSYMCTASFWNFIIVHNKTKKPKTKRPKPAEAEDDYQTRMKSVTFGPVEVYPAEAGPQRALQQLYNKVILCVTIATIGVPILYILIDVFKEGDVDIINYDHKCWIGGHGGLLMYILVYIPTVITTLATISFYIWCGVILDKAQFLSSKPDNPEIRNFQLRVVLVSGLGLWWMVEIPTLANHTPAAATVQHINGLINIPLAILTYYTFVVGRPEIAETWNRHAPFIGKSYKAVSRFWYYNIYRKITQKVFRVKTKHREEAEEWAEEETEEDTPDNQDQDQDHIPDYNYDNQGVEAQYNLVIKELTLL